MRINQIQCDECTIRYEIAKEKDLFLCVIREPSTSLTATGIMEIDLDFCSEKCLIEFFMKRRD